MSNYEIRQDRAEVTIKFGRGLMDEPFTSKNGKELVEIKIPNPDPDDRRPWESFVVPASFVHDNQYGKGVWMKLPEDGTTRLTRPVRQGQDEQGKPIWGKETREVSNSQLKALMEAYKEKSRSSVMGDLTARQSEASDRAFTPRSDRDRDLPFR